MRKRTWDIIARYVSDEMGIKIVISEDCPGPRINLKSMTIHLPEKIKDQNALAALSSLIHEAAHMKYSTIIPTDLATTDIDHFILNAMEDVRIDRKCFRILPNIFGFYEIFIKEHLCTKENKENIDKQHMLTRCMIQLIVSQEGFYRYTWDHEALTFVKEKGIDSLFMQGIYAIEVESWDKVKECIKEIKSKFKFETKKEPKGEPNGSGDKEPCSGGAGRPGDSKEEDKHPAREAKKPKDSNDGSGVAGRDKQDEVQNPEGLLRPASVWGKGEGLKGPGGQEFDPVQLTEITKRKFIETLNTKEKYIQSDGHSLDTDNLIALFTGQIEELFKEDCVEKVKKSKIVFCLDASGSMSTRLMDHSSRKQVLASSVKSLVSILDEVRETEGLNVDYEIVLFNSSPKLANRNDWWREYFGMGGGTNIVGAMSKSIQILNDSDVDGNRFVVLVTDGDVGSLQIQSVRDMILKNNNEIKAMLLGIGAKPTFTKMLCGENNILFLEHADQIIMESIQTMLEE